MPEVTLKLQAKKVIKLLDSIPRLNVSQRPVTLAPCLQPTIEEKRQKTKNSHILLFAMSYDWIGV